MKAIKLKLALMGLARESLCLIFLCGSAAYGQPNRVSKSAIQLSLQQAIDLGKVNNNLIKAAKSEESAANADLADAKTAALPSVFANADYQRFTSLMLYESFLGGAHAVPKNPSPNGADAGLSASFNLYAGGKQKALEAEQAGRKELSAVNTREQSGRISLEIAFQYLSMVRLNDQKRFMEDLVIRADTRLKNINALYLNQKVTRSDVLRAELQLSSVKLNLEQVENDIRISNQKLNVLLALPDSAMVSLTDSSNMPRSASNDLLPLLTGLETNAFEINKAAFNIKVQDARVNGIRSNYSPSVTLFSAYGLSYPNTIFYPPVDQAYSIGFLGIKVQYNISSLYQNKNKMTAGKTKLRELQYIRQNIIDDLNQEASGLLIKYREALHRVTVSEQSIEQARVNYKIVSAKYFNQLALLTDLLDADNLYQESRFSLVQAQTSARFLYYQLLFTAGKL